MPYARLEASVLSHGLCARCGGCVAVCPGEVIELGDDGAPAATLSAAAMDDACGACDLCTDVCPGLDPGVPAAELRRYGRTRQASERWTGIVRRYRCVASPDAVVRRSSAAGGAGTALLLAALQTGIADAVLVMGRDPERPWVPSGVITDDPDVIVGCGQSTYCLSPTLQLLRQTRYQRIAMVGLPCEIQSLEKMRSLTPMPDSARRVGLTLELACSSNTLRGGTEHLVERRLGLDLAEVASVRYRDGGYPGEFAVEDRSGQRHTLPFHELVGSFTDFRTRRCSTCPDWWSGLADVSICDADQNIFKSSRAGTDGKPASLVALRSERAERLLAAAVDLGLLEAGPGDLDEDHNLGLQRKRHRYNRAVKARGAAKIPLAPGADNHRDAALDDGDVIARLS